MTVNTAGEQILPYAQALVEDYRKLESHIDDINGVQTGTIRIGTFAGVAINWLPDVLADFQQDYPAIEYEMLLGDYDEVETWLEEGRVDCGFLSLPAHRRFEVMSLRKDEYVVVLPQRHPLTEQTEIPIEALEGEPFILLERGGRTEVTKLLEQSGVRPKIRFTTWEDYAIMAMVEKGLGIGILPRLILERIPYQVEIRSLQEPYYREIGIAVKDRKMLSPATERFLEYL